MLGLDEKDISDGKRCSSKENICYLFIRNGMRHMDAQERGLANRTAKCSIIEQLERPVLAIRAARSRQK